MKNEIEHNNLSFSKTGPKDLWPGVSNYVLQVASSSDPESRILTMYFLDSGGGSYPEVISSAQAEWFQHKSQEINPDSRYRKCEAITFFWSSLSGDFNDRLKTVEMMIWSIPY